MGDYKRSPRYAGEINVGGVKMPMMWTDRINEDAINPPHYQQYEGFEVIDVTEQLNFCLGNAAKYILRAGHKPGNSKVQDLEKAKWYIEREIRRVENEDSN